MLFILKMVFVKYILHWSTSQQERK